MKQAFVVCGSPGAGKTSYAQKLATKHHAVLLDIDTVAERLVQAGMAAANLDLDDRDSRTFKHHFRQPIYDTLFTIARENLPWIPVIIVGPFTRELRDPTWPEQLSKLLAAPIEIHYVYCRPEIRKQRLIDRGNPRDAAKIATWNDHKKYYGDESAPSFSHVYVDTSEA